MIIKLKKKNFYFIDLFKINKLFKVKKLNK